MVINRAVVNSTSVSRLDIATLRSGIMEEVTKGGKMAYETQLKSKETTILEMVYKVKEVLYKNNEVLDSIVCRGQGKDVSEARPEQCNLLDDIISELSTCLNEAEYGVRTLVECIKQKLV